MKVRVTYTTYVDDDFRMALAHSWGECGRLAGRDEIKGYLERVGQNTDEDVLEEWANCERCQDATR